ncbi:hypothetical protein [Blastococcus montanus]|uniref:hypothetical protein n=1 Tax=Blastococcus montanus TaxID=3144973 RepID=UPI003207C2C2
MGGYGDPEALEALAAELHRRAGQVREAADEHARTTDRACWVSDAAAVHRRELAADRAAVEAAADGMDAAADVLRRHADEVRERIAAIARAEREVRAWLADRAARGGELLDRVGEVLGELPEAGADVWRQIPGRLTRLGLW